MIIANAELKDQREASARQIYRTRDVSLIGSLLKGLLKPSSKSCSSNIQTNTLMCKIQRSSFCDVTETTGTSSGCAIIVYEKPWMECGHSNENRNAQVGNEDLLDDPNHIESLEDPFKRLNEESNDFEYQTSSDYFDSIRNLKSVPKKNWQRISSLTCDDDDNGSLLGHDIQASANDRRVPYEIYRQCSIVSNESFRTKEISLNNNLRLSSLTARDFEESFRGTSLSSACPWSITARTSTGSQETMYTDVYNDNPFDDTNEVTNFSRFMTRKQSSSTLASSSNERAKRGCYRRRYYVGARDWSAAAFEAFKHDHYNPHLRQQQD